MAADRSVDERGGAELRRRLLPSLVVASGVVAGFFAVFHVVQGQTERALASLSALVAVVVILAIWRAARSIRPPLLVATLYASLMTLGMLATGAYAPADFIWCLLVPLLIAYAGGHRLARWALPAYTFAAVVIVLLPWFGPRELWHELELTVRFVALLALVSAVAYLYERARSRAQAELEEVNRRLSESVAEAERLAEQAEAASESKTRFLSQMSHDIRTPLTGIVGMASLLELTELEAAQREYVGTIRTGADALTELIGDILDLARIEAGRVELTPAAMDARVLLEEVRLVLAPQAESKGLSLVADVDPAMPEQLLGDAARLRQILLNLGGNAVKFTASGRVSLSMVPRPGEDDPWWRIEVQDSGIGIPREQQARIFDRFHQVEDATQAGRTGSGLGLAICTRLVGLMGGEIGVESVVGQGSTFHVDLPLTIPSAEEVQETPEEQELPDVGSQRLLLVDDNATVRTVIGAMLRRAGHDVDTVSDGSAAVARLALHRYDAVLMDVQMPGAGGIETTGWLRAGAGGVLQPDIPVVGITALADPTTHTRCKAAGMCQVVTKPVGTDALRRAIALALGA